MTTNIQGSATKSWAMLTAKIRAQVQETYHRALILEHRIRYVNHFFVACAWFTTQIPPPLTDYVRQINTAIAWFLGRGAIFRVPLSTLQRPKGSGGRSLIHIMAKFMTLFMLRMEKQGRRTDTFTADWLTKWRLHGTTPNPLQIKRIPTKFDPVYRYNIESANAPMRGTAEHPKTYKRRLYAALLTSIQAAAGFPELRVQNLWPNID